MTRTTLLLPSFLVILLLPVPAPAQQPPERTPLTYEQAVSGGGLYRPDTKAFFRWAEDRKHLVGPDGKWIDPLSSAEVVARPPAKEEKKEPKEPSLREQAKKALEKARGDKGVPGAAFGGKAVMSTLPRTPERDSGAVESPDQSLVAVFIDGELWGCPKNGEPKLLAPDAKGWSHVEAAPGGRRLSYLRGFNLHLLDTTTGRQIPVTTDGSENLFYGELDWVYQEEVYGRGDFKATWWAPGGAYLAYLRIDESEVPTFAVVDHIPFRIAIEELKYPKSGDPNPTATLHVARAEDGKSVAVNLSKYKDEEQILIVRVTWDPAGDRLVYQVQDREQTWLDLNVADPKTGKTTTLFRETSRAWVNVLGQPRWLKDGGFLWESERTGYKHLYRYDHDGKLRNAVTTGDWQVDSVTLVDEEKGEIQFTGSKDGAANTNHYLVRLDGSGFVSLTSGPGSHSISFNHDRSLFLDAVNALDNPGEQRLCRADGTVVRILATARLPENAAGYGFSRPEFVSLPARDGYLLDASIVMPFATDAGKKHPVWINTYSGPHSPTVSNSWRGDTWTQFLAQEGYLSLQVNVRSASGRGQHHHDACYKQFGVQELKDIEDAVAWVVQNRNADADRVGITGVSYGGFMAAYALTHSTAFKLGIAGAGVFDWRNYDTIYTERYMRTPQNNPEGYKLGSCIDGAANLHGYLLIWHGTTDDNVHLQNALQLAYALEKAGKDFGLMLYPKSRHGVQDPQLGRHLRNLTWKTMREKL